MRPLALLFAGSFLLSAAAQACLNFSDVTLEGKHRETAGEDLAYTRVNLTRRVDASVWQERGEKLLAAAKAHQPTVLEMSDYAVVLAHLGSYQDSLQILEAAEKREPGHSVIASNLGTVYELLGDNDRARAWVAIGIKRNPKDHDGTEWLHLKILDAKLAIAKDPNWLKTHSALGPEFDHGTEKTPKAATKGGQILADAIGYQLSERLEFVKAPEPIVGELLFALGDEMALKGSVAIALDLYEFSATFQPERADLLLARTQLARSLVKDGKTSTVPKVLKK